MQSREGHFDSLVTRP
nr:unnamed protein product [Callosobruchus chinensis]